MKKFLVFAIVCSLALPMLGRTELPLDKLALYMSFDNVSGDTVKDESKNGNAVSEQIYTVVCFVWA